MNTDKVWNKNTSANILVVDDDRQIADMLKDYLVGRGYAVTAAYSGRDALAAFSTGNFHIVIVDMRMPDVDGMAVLKSVRKTDPAAGAGRPDFDRAADVQVFLAAPDYFNIYGKNPQCH